MYIKIKNGQPETYSVRQLRRDNSQVSFPQDITKNTLAQYHVYPVTPVEPPNHAANEVVEDAGFAQLSDGTWQQAWRVRSMTEQELEQLVEQRDEQRRTAYQNEADPLFFKWQRRESTEKAWLDKISEIKARSYE
jgi:hypothetical protein